MNVEQPTGFICTMCGDCCRGMSEARNVLLSPEDINRGSSALGITPKEFEEKFTESIEFDLTESIDRVHRLKWTSDGACVFLGPDNECKVHLGKPLQCACGPFGFMWDGERYWTCMKDVDISETWSSYENDAEFASDF